MSSSPGEKTRDIVTIHADSGLTGDGTGLSLIQAPDFSDSVKEERPGAICRDMSRNTGPYRTISKCLIMPSPGPAYHSGADKRISELSEVLIHFVIPGSFCGIHKK